jgi:hypothetical protein
MDRGEGGLSVDKGGNPPGDNNESDNVVPLGVEAPTPTPPAPAKPLGRLHGLAILGMAVFALVGIAAMLAFITISWPDDTSRYVVAVFVASIIGFMTSASLAVFSAARDTYPRHPRKPNGD